MNKNKIILILNCSLDGIIVSYPEDEKPHISDMINLDKVELPMCRHRTIPYEVE